MNYSYFNIVTATRSTVRASDNVKGNITSFVVLFSDSTVIKNTKSFIKIHKCMLSLAFLTKTNFTGVGNNVIHQYFF